MIKITGNTFQHRDLLRSINARWNADEKCWVVRSLTTSDKDRLKSIVGIVVSEPQSPVPPAPIQFDNPLEMFEQRRKRPKKNAIGNTKPKLYGNDETYFNYFKDQNPLAFFGFSSLVDFANYVKAVPIDVQKQTKGERNAGWDTSVKSWYGTPNMNAALDLAANGWAEGIEAAEQILEEITTEYSSSKKRINSLAGGQVSVGRMLSGNPKHMKKKAKQPKKRVVTLFVESAIINSVSAVNVAIRAATVCAIADLIEQQGYSCEINAVMMISKNSTHTLPGAQMCVTLKNSNERLNLSDVAFSLGHPSFFRRMIFGAIGSSLECEPIWRTMGYPTSAFNENHKVRDNEFYIRQLLPEHQRQLNNAKTVKDKALKMLPLIKPVNLPIEIKEN